MKVKIFSCNHVRPPHVIDTELFQSFVSGMVPEPGSGILTDMGGKNIASAQKFCELRHQYYIWQNEISQYDYVGFEHYRRLFNIDPLGIDALKARYPELEVIRDRITADPHGYMVGVDEASTYQMIMAMRRSLVADEIMAVKNWVKSYDVIYTLPIFELVEDNYAWCHPDGSYLWAEMKQVLATSYPYSRVRNVLDFVAGWSGYLNMYIMRSELFVEYMDSIFPVLLGLERKFPDAPSRIWGHISERLLGSFIIQKQLETPGLRFRAVPNLTFARNACE
ncbi:MAG: hypothetical protein B7Z75_05190 [Acidocella sp. 20-57-95]|nr:MAG: hypothetical protein B7Z75_05190 [Acidocella sp. 20-57-95]HQT64660.1 DUF4422 domain-containing protein [Acidocella sp.]